MQSATALRRRLPYFASALVAFILLYFLANQVEGVAANAGALNETFLLFMVLELMAALAMFFGFAGRFVAIGVGLTTLVLLLGGYLDGYGLVYVVALLVGCVGVIFLGTGADSAWQPGEADFARGIPRARSGGSRRRR